VRMHDNQVDSDEALVHKLLSDQFPEWAGLTISRLETDGTDNAIYRLGDEFVMRLPLIHWAVAQVEKEHTWLPKIAPLLPLAVPAPLMIGEPGHGYPWHWSVHRWIDGENAHPDRIIDAGQAAIDLAGFATALHAVNLPGAPVSQRGVSLVTRDKATRWAINAVRREFDSKALTEVWEEALAAPPWDGPPVWVHADLTDGNILARDGRLYAVIDFSTLGLGEPANDLDAAWDLFSGESRTTFREALGIDDATWARGRGWAITSVFGIPYYEHTNPGIVARARRRIAAVLAEH
jgi:aminoglycoside phosphotransferase (APT) family kinase protein